MNVFLDMVGCRANQAEIERYARQFRAAGHQVVGSLKDADLVVINTCAVTSAAASDSRQKIHQACRVGARQIVITGCLGLSGLEDFSSFPGVERIIPNSRKDNLVSELLNQPEIILRDFKREPLPGKRLRTRAFIKAQDGCDHFCTYCITRLARGKSRSVSKEDVVEEIIAAEKGGAKEAILCGIQLGSWGNDFSKKENLAFLVNYVLEKTEIPRLRLSSVEPWGLNDDFFDLWKNPRMCRQLHIPLQSGCRDTLARMGRKSSPELFRDYIAAARMICPEIAITTDIMVGFPGESDLEFEESREFIQSINFAGGHVFKFSSRPMVPAAEMKDQVPFAIRKSRSIIISELLHESSSTYRRSFLGKEVEVLWESAKKSIDGQWEVQGLTDNYIKVSAITNSPRWNKLDYVQINALTSDGVSGAILEQD